PSFPPPRRFPGFGAPTGRDSKAQGNALGNVRQKNAPGRGATNPVDSLPPGCTLGGLLRMFVPRIRPRGLPEKLPLALALIALACLAPAIAAAERAPARPNILFILIDDHAANMTSVLNESPVHTPNLERLAARSSWFTHAYADVPSCAPS